MLEVFCYVICLFIWYQIYVRFVKNADPTTTYFPLWLMILVLYLVSCYLIYSMFHPTEYPDVPISDEEIKVLRQRAHEIVQAIKEKNN